MEVEPVTLFSMLIAAMLGGIVGQKYGKAPGSEDPYGFVSNASVCGSTASNEKVNGFGPFGMLGNGNRLSGGKLILSVAINFILGMLMCAGVGLYATMYGASVHCGNEYFHCWELIMMGCALLMPASLNL